MTLLPYVRAAVVGSASGLRSMTGPALTARAGSTPWVGLLTTLALGELVADKLPFAPSRLLPPALIGRLVAGGLCGATVAARARSNRVGGFVAGGAAAVAASYAGYYLRRYLTERLGWPNIAVALVEDGVAVGGSLVANAR